MNPNLCPICGKPGRWRSGAGYDHEKICGNRLGHPDGHNVVWCPDELANDLRAIADSKINTEGDGI